MRFQEQVVEDTTKTSKLSADIDKANKKIAEILAKEKKQKEVTDEVVNNLDTLKINTEKTDEKLEEIKYDLEYIRCVEHFFHDEYSLFN